jgi:hypothetical protein
MAELDFSRSQSKAMPRKTHSSALAKKIGLYFKMRALLTSKSHQRPGKSTATGPQRGKGLVMNEVLEMQEKATKLVHWPTGLTYACDHHAESLQKIASSMGIHIAIESYHEGKMRCTNCDNENSIARGDADE